MSETGAERQHEPTCAYYGLRFKTGSANRICSCPGRVTPPTVPAGGFCGRADYSDPRCRVTPPLPVTSE